MKKFICIFITLTILISISTYVYTLFNIRRHMVDSYTNLTNTIISANRYAIKGLQDLDSYRDVISKDSNSRMRYNQWLKGMENYKEVRVNFNGVVSYGSSSYTEDTGFTKSVIPFLKKQLTSSSAKYSPLDFGITYLDKERLEEDVVYYIKTSMLNEGRTFNMKKSGVHYFDPHTIKVVAQIEYLPINLKEVASSTEMTGDYLRLFGANNQINKDIIKNKSDISTAVRVIVKYRVYPQFIPKGWIGFRLNSEKALELGSRAKNSSSMSEPPLNVYYPNWYNEVPGQSKLAGARIKTNPDLDAYIEYEFSYMLTH